MALSTSSLCREGRLAAPVLYPLTFHPIFKERVWGGRRLQELYRKELPEGVPIGESWEISDRPGDVSLVANGPLAGVDLHSLVQRFGADLIGPATLYKGRFPLLIKILDAQQKLSLQVHPPASEAERLCGEPKTEMWYVADAAPEAQLYVGLRRGIKRAAFQRKIEAGTVEDCFHRIGVRAGDAMFLPSGRVHAIGAGLVIFEVQQNSDTTYRVFDWNRVGLDGKPRQLHVAESLSSIDFEDFEPKLIEGESLAPTSPPARRLVADKLFTVDLVEPGEGSVWSPKPGTMQILGLLSGQLQVRGGETEISLRAGQFCLLPAALQGGQIQAPVACKILRIFAGEN